MTKRKWIILCMVIASAVFVVSVLMIQRIDMLTYVSFSDNFAMSEQGDYYLRYNAGADHRKASLESPYGGKITFGNYAKLTEREWSIAEVVAEKAADPDFLKDYFKEGDQGLTGDLNLTMLSTEQIQKAGYYIKECGDQVVVTFAEDGTLDGVYVKASKVDGRLENPEEWQEFLDYAEEKYNTYVYHPIFSEIF